MIDFVFTENLSDIVNFSGPVKLKIDNLKNGMFLILLEEDTSGNYVPVGPWGVFRNEETNASCYLQGNYRFKRSHSEIEAGYEQ